MRACSSLCIIMLGVLMVETLPLHMFIGISSHHEKASDHGELASMLRTYQRNSWMRWLDTNSSRFFVHSVGKHSRGSHLSLEKDVVIVPLKYTQRCNKASHHCRSGQMVRFILNWALSNTESLYIITTEHDNFVCVPQLEHVLTNHGTPNLLLAHWFELNHRSGIECLDTFDSFIGHTEQSFSVYGRNLAKKMVGFVDTAPEYCYQSSLSWAKNIRPMIQYLHTKGEIDIIMDDDRIVVHDNILVESWVKFGPPSPGSHCPLFQHDLAGINDTKHVKQQSMKWTESICACGAISYHMRTQARKRNMFENKTSSMYSNALKWISAPDYDLAHQLAPLSPLRCNLGKSCPSAVLQPSNQSEAWWKCPSHQLDRFNKPLEGGALEEALTCDKH